MSRHIHFICGKENTCVVTKISFSLFVFVYFIVCCATDLRYDPQTLPQAVEADVSDILPRYVDVPLLGLIEAEQQPHNSALPATRRGTNRQHNSVCELHPHSVLMISDDKTALHIQMR